MTEENGEAEQLKQDPKIREALTRNKKANNRSEAELSTATVKKSSSLWLFVIMLIVAGILYVLLSEGIISIQTRHERVLQNIAAGVALTMLLLIINRLLRAYLVDKIQNPSTRYNLRRIIDLAIALIIVFIALSIIFSNWYTVVVSLGLISLILGLALQNPLTSFFGWIYILIRKPYEVGDRIKIGGVTGDVISLSYFDTTLWEFRGDYISGDHPSGRVIRFANAKVFNEYIINYSWPLFPYIWKEVKFFVSYESDLHFVETTIKQVILEEIGDEMQQRVNLYRSILKETPVNELEVRASGSVKFQAHHNAWIEVIARFLVEPKQSGAIKGRLFAKMLQALRAQPEKVMFPKADLR